MTLRTLMFLCLTLALTGCFLLPEEEKPIAPPRALATDSLPAYDTITAERRDLVQQVSVVGHLTAREKADLFFRYQGGRLTNLRVRVDDQVKKGDVLAELDVAELELSVEAARLRARKARVTLEMLQASQANRYQLTLADLDVQLAEVELRGMERAYDARRLVSTLDGVVVWIDAVEGDYVEAFQPVIRVADPSSLLLQCEVDTPADFPRGATVTVALKGRDLRGTVVMTPADAGAQVSAKPAEGVTGGFDLQLLGELPARRERLLVIDVAGLPRDAALDDVGLVTRTLATARNAVVLPRDVIHSYSGRTYVNLLRDGEIQERDVELGIELASEVQVARGLEGGELVIRR